jgi:hypothetical protein
VGEGAVVNETVERLRGATRWSMAARCARQASYGLLGAEPEEPSSRLQGRFARGRDAGRYVARQLAAKYGEENVVFEMAVPWPKAPALPVGELHVDIAIVSEKIAVEVKNTVWVDSMYDSAVTQLAGALYNAPEKFESGLLIFVDNDYQITHEYPIFLTDELREKVEQIMASVIEAGATGQVPERICEKPADGKKHLCPFIDQCFAGWEKPEPIDAEGLSQLASEGWLIQRDLQAAKGNEKELQERWDEWKEHMAAATADQPPGVELLAGPVKIKRIDVKARETFKKSKAVTAGVWTDLDDERFAPFVNIGEPGVRFDLTRTEAGPDLDLDFGEEAPF